jgi:Mrp family chromosome partitioning ATPase
MDSPPVLLVADASVLASMVDGVIIVADASAIRASSTRATLKAISVTQTDIVGAVVNKLRLPRFVGSAAYPYYYHYSSQDRYYYGGDENSTNGTGTFYQRAAGRAKSVFSRIRGRGK